MPEPWPRIYREAPELFAAFGRAEDPDGRIAQRLRALAGLPGREVLEIGAGTGRYSQACSQGTAEYFAVEPSPEMACLAKQALRGTRVHCVRARGEHLPFKDQSLDRVVATWVLAYLRPAACGRVVQEALRVLRAGGIWLVENHWTGAFQELRGRAGLEGEPGLGRLLEEHGFRVVEVIESELRFPSALEAQRILGALCGPEVGQRLAERPLSRLGHHVAILHRPL